MNTPLMGLLDTVPPPATLHTNNIAAFVWFVHRCRFDVLGVTLGAAHRGEAHHPHERKYR